MPTNNGVRLYDRQRIANFREQPIETNEYQAVDGAEGEFFWSSSPQNVYLLSQSPNLCLECCPRPDQIDNRPTNKPEKIPHYTTSSPDSPLPASRMRFTTGTMVARRDRSFQRLEELCWVHSNRLANGQKFHDVDAAFTAFIFGHKRLRLMKAISQLALGQTSGFASLDHKFAKGDLAP
jgi:hypothetical protein